MFLFCSFSAVTSLSGIRDVRSTLREDIEYELSVERLPSICKKEKRGRKKKKKQSIMFLTGSKSETFLMRQRAVRKLVN